MKGYDRCMLHYRAPEIMQHVVERIELHWKTLEAWHNGIKILSASSILILRVTVHNHTFYPIIVGKRERFVRSGYFSNRWVRKRTEIPSLLFRWLSQSIQSYRTTTPSATGNYMTYFLPLSQPYCSSCVWMFRRRKTLALHNIHYTSILLLLVVSIKTNGSKLV